MTQATPKISYQDCWAKTNPSGFPVLSVHDHCLTVGHVANQLIAHLPHAVARHFPRGAVSLIAAHDLGKLTPGFQLKCPAWGHFAALSQSINHNNLCTNHAAISHWHLQNILPRAVSAWLASTAGHHGSYPFGNRRQTKEPFEGGNRQFEPLRDNLLEHLIEIFGPLPTEPARHREEHIHLLTGLTIFSDWIGSNTDWFPLEAPVLAESIQTKTQQIQSDLGRAARIIPSRTFGQQFNPSAPGDFHPRAIQRELLRVADAPGLYIVEAPMGVGKTEAALTAAYQLWQNDHSRGLYFALPTQLTSNKIHERITAFLINTIGEKSVQTLVHGNAWLKKERTRQLAPPSNSDGLSLPDLEHNDTDEVLRWYSSTRKALLAPFGSGTIDQALLAVLPARFAALRYFALAGKVVILDEIHSYDPYMSALIDRLISHLIKAGSTVIVLSATLTAKRRNQLVRAAGATEPLAPTSYPLITKVPTDSPTATHHSTSETLPSKTIHLEHQSLTPESEQTYWQTIADLAEDGANIVIIRNTVALAQQTYLQIKGTLTARVPDENVGLIHSRFPQWQREENEGSWTVRLGKDDASRPQGSVLVSTQILEQSVDIDADLLITDLAPVDLILQRIGRLHRHDRTRPTNCREPRCHILHPRIDWHGDAKQVLEHLSPHHFIYPPLTLWQASTYLKPKKALNLPQQIRQTLEEAAAQSPEPGSSPALEQFVTDYQKQENEQTGTANTRGIFSASAIQDLEGAETRYKIRPSANLILLRQRPEIRGTQITIKPLQPDPESPQSSYTIYQGQFSYPLARSLHLNAARVSSYLVSPLLPKAPDWLKHHIDSAILAVVPPSGTELQLYPDAPNPYTLHYHPIHGITHERTADIPSESEPEEDWY